MTNEYPEEYYKRMDKYYMDNVKPKIRTEAIPEPSKPALKFTDDEVEFLFLMWAIISVLESV